MADSEKDRRPRLDPDERKKATEGESLNEAVTYEVVRKEGEKELDRSLGALWWAAVAGGTSMGFSFVTEALLRSHLPEAEWRPLITKLGYPVGFLIISLGSQQLFTENTITPVVPMLVKRTRQILAKVAALWTVVLAGNLTGALVFAALIAHTSAFDPPVHAAFSAVAIETMKGPASTIFIKAVFAGWLIALMVWMLPAGKREQVPTIIIMTYIIGIGSLSHVVVGSDEVLYMVVTGTTSAYAYLSSFLLPALTGNIVGGVVFVTALNHAQVAFGKNRRR